MITVHGMSMSGNCHKVRLALEQQRQANDLPPPLPIALPEHVRRRDVPVRPHNLNAYDHLMENDDDQR